MSTPDIPASISAVLKKIQMAADRTKSKAPRLVAVSKTKPVELVKAAYDAGLKVFGENYVQEIVEKAPQLPDDIEWHFIGHLQSNKAGKLIEGVPNLAMIETIHGTSIAKKIDGLLERHGRPIVDALVQVNTSGEDTKSGVEPSEAIVLQIEKKSNNVDAVGFMTIGMPDFTSRPEDFQLLLKCREEAAEALGIDPDGLECSMGMSNDYEQAIEMGSTNVRVGSAIFGARSYNN